MKLQIILIILPIILSLSPRCHADINYFTCAMSLLKFGRKLLGFIPDRRKEEVPSEIKIEMDRLGHRLDDYFNTVRDDIGQVNYVLKEGLKNIANKNSLVETQRYLQDAALKIGNRFKVLKKMQQDLNRKTTDFSAETFHLRMLDQSYVEDLWSGIKSTFNTAQVLSRLSHDFITSKLVFENVCDAKVSRLQLLEHLLVYFQTVSTQVFFGQHIILNYYEKYHSEGLRDSTPKELYATRREDWNRNFHGDYFEILNLFEANLKTISSKVWSCDPNKFDESNYLELKAYTKYYIRGVDFKPKFYNCAIKCMSDNEHGPQNSLDDCMSSRCSKIDSHLKYVDRYHGNESGLREKTRDCKEAPTDCKLRPDGTGPLYACIEEDSKTAYKRYTKIQPDKNCIYGSEALDISAKFAIDYPLDCVCPEKSYYISTLHRQADNGHVIVGAQIQMSNDNILYIKVKQGKPMERGIIPKTKWLDAPLDDLFTQGIYWGNCDEFDLSEITLPKDRVIVGLGFTGCIDGRIHLRVTTKTFDLETGTVGDDLREEELIRGTQQYNVNNTDVPMRGRDKNRPIDLTKDGDYVKLSLSSLELDAGQTTVPFIDVQEVVPAIPVALSGASLVLRTQTGYGGFLGLQLFTYNVFTHMPPHVNYTQAEIDETLMNT